MNEFESSSSDIDSVSVMDDFEDLIDMLAEAIIGGHFDTIEHLLEKYPQLLDYEYLEGFNPLICAISEGENVDMIMFLIESGYSIDIYGAGALINAAHESYFTVVKKLVELGVDVNSNNTYALISAAYGGSCNIINYLIDNGADIHARNDSAIVAAVDHYNVSALKCLIKRGADVNAQDGEPLKVAVERGDDVITKILLKNGADVDIRNKKLFKIASNIVNGANVLKLLKRYRKKD